MTRFTRPLLLAALLPALLAACGDEPRAGAAERDAAGPDTTGYFDQDLGQEERDSARADTAVRRRAAAVQRRARVDAGLPPEDSTLRSPPAPPADSAGTYGQCMQKVQAAPPDARDLLRQACERSRQNQ